MMIRHFIALSATLLICIAPAFLFAQDADQERLDAYIQEIKESIHRNHNAADSICNDLYNLALKQGAKREMGVALYYKGVSRVMEEENHKAEILFDQAYDLLIVKEDSDYLASLFNSKGIALANEEKYDKAMAAFDRCSYWAKKNNNHKLVANAMANIVSIQIKENAVSEAFELINEMDSYQSEHGHFHSTLHSKGLLFASEGITDSASYYYLQALTETQFDYGPHRYIGSKLSILEDMAAVEDYASIQNYMTTIEDSIKEHSFPAKEARYLKLKAEVLFALGQKSEAVEIYNDCIEVTELAIAKKVSGVVQDDDASKELEEIESNIDRIDHELVGFESGIKVKTTWYITVALTALLLLAIAIVFLLKQRRIGRSLENRNKHILVQREKIKEGISIAKEMQEWMLQTERNLQNYLPESFIMYQPKDEVSGDVYWFDQVGNELVLASIDCTGHGIPGAFMSLIAHEKINYVVKELGKTKPNEVMDALKIAVQDAFDNDGSGQSFSDGMDVSVCTINLDTQEMTFAGAFSSIMVLKKGEVIEYKADPIAIGQASKADAPFTLKNVDIEKGDCLFMYSDGYLDQFGGELGKKFNKKNFRELILKAGRRPMEQARQIFIDTFESWKASEKQVDDVMIIGLRVS